MEYMNQRLVRVALGQEPADLIIRGGKLINVYTRRVYPADVAIADGRIAAVGDVDYCAGAKTDIVDATGKFLAPGLIDAHIHPDVSKITITRMANALAAARRHQHHVPAGPGGSGRWHRRHALRA